MKQVLAVQHDNTIAEIPSPDQVLKKFSGYIVNTEFGQLVLFVKCDSMISNEETAFSCCQTTPTADPKVWAVFRFTGGSDPVLSQNGMITDSIHAVTGSRITQRRERV